MTLPASCAGIGQRRSATTGKDETLNAVMTRNLLASAALALALLLATCAGDPPLVQWAFVEVSESVARSSSPEGGEGIGGASESGAADAAGDATSGEDVVAGPGGRGIQQPSEARADFDTLHFGGGPLLDSAVEPLDGFAPVGDAGEPDGAETEDADSGVGAGLADALGASSPFGHGLDPQWFGHWGVTGGIGGVAQLSAIPDGGTATGTGGLPAFGGDAPAFTEQVTHDELFDSMPPFVANRGPTAIPEPSALALLLTTLVGLGLLRSLGRLASNHC